jgi:hypothetical protein
MLGLRGSRWHKISKLGVLETRPVRRLRPIKLKGTLS